MFLLPMGKLWFVSIDLASPGDDLSLDTLLSSLRCCADALEVRPHSCIRGCGDVRPLAKSIAFCCRWLWLADSLACPAGYLYKHDLERTDARIKRRH